MAPHVGRGYFFVADARSVHHWDGSSDSVASLWHQKNASRLVPLKVVPAVRTIKDHVIPRHETRQPVNSE